MTYPSPGMRAFSGICVAAAALAAIASPLCAQQLVPPNQNPVAQIGAEPILKSYSLPAGGGEAIANALTAQFPPETGARISFDTRTSQLLVFALPAVHEQIAVQVAGTPTASAPATLQPIPAVNPTATPGASNSQAKTRGPKVVPLTRLSPEDFEQALAKIFGRPLPVRVERDGQWARYTLDTRGGRVSMIVDRSAKQVALEGPVKLADAWAQVVEAIDRRPPTVNEETHVVTLAAARSADVTKALVAYQQGAAGDGRNLLAADSKESKTLPVKKNSRAGRLVSMIFQQRDDNAAADENQDRQAQVAQAQPGDQPPPGQQPPNQPDNVPPGQDDETGGALIGQVQIEFLEGLDALVVRGHPSDVEKVTKIIEEIERLSTETEPSIEIYPLRHVNSLAITTLVQQLYDQVILPRQGRISITPLVKPNSLLLIGRPEAVASVTDLVKRLDIPVAPTAMFQVFPLRNTSAGTAKQTVDQFFLSRTSGLGGVPVTVADFRSNSLVVQASPSDLQEVQSLLQKIDVATTSAVNDLRVFQLKNSLAEELAPVIQNAISASQPGTQQQQQQQQFQVPGQPQQPFLNQQGGQAATQGRSAALRFVTVDGDIRQGLRSGILTDVRINADPRANTLIVSAPADSMDLVAALIEQLDQLPSAEAQVKVFEIYNGDAVSLMQMLQSLFGMQVGNQGGGGFGGGLFGGGQNQFGGGPGEGGLVTLRFSADQRTNTIIASGSTNDLLVVEAILSNLESINVRSRQSLIYKLKNVYAPDVANSIQTFLNMERNVQLQFQPTGTINPFEQMEREVVVVAEPTSNSLIVSATPRFFDEIQKLIIEIDKRPPMVVTQVLIAEVTLNNTDEWGVELGLQDSVLFDRSLFGTALNPPATVSGAPAASPGYNFNNQPLGNGTSTGRTGRVGTQGLSNFSLGRINNELGYGGFVFSASSESVSVLLRALSECRRVDILSRPQITTMDNQLAYLQVGQRVPRITASNITTTGTINTVTLDNVGIILNLQPRISPDNVVTMLIDAEKSEVGPQEDGIPISINNNGDVIRSPRYDTTVAQTTVSAANGQTIVLGGLITSRKEQAHRRVPYLSNLPVVGQLFRYDSVFQRRTELLIVMTPHVVRSEAEADRIKRTEAARMSWCLGDVIKVDGDRGLRGRGDEFSDEETVVVYPEMQPTGQSPTLADPSTAADPNATEEIPPPTGNPRPTIDPNRPAPSDPTLQQGKREQTKTTL